MKNTFIAIAALAPVALAQSPVWGQCGGNNWTGPKTCAAGSSCVLTNEWYSQCIPGSNNPTTTASRTPTTTPSQTTTSVSRTPTTSAGVTTTVTTSGTAVTTTRVSTTTANPGTPGTGVTLSGNPFLSVKPFPNPYYASEINNIAIPSLTSAALKTAAAKVAEVGTFAWMDTRSKVPLLESHLIAIRAANKAGQSPPFIGQFVVYDLPDRDCAAAASNGEYSLANGGAALYKSYIDAIKALLVQFSDVKMVLLIEPDSLANLITNQAVPKCAGAASAYLELTNYAIKSLALPNVSMYLDGGHGGWLGWPANIDPAVAMYAKVYKDAGSPSQLRGLAFNVANYNGWSLSTCPSYTTPNPNCDEKKYANAIGPKLAAAGWNARFIVDTGRNGVQPTAQIAQGDWCNLIGTGFGVRPTTNTGDALVDAFVWIKPGGECDGTSDTSAARYDFHCGLADALKPAPEAGAWFQAYFEQLLKNANPPF